MTDGTQSNEEQTEKTPEELAAEIKAEEARVAAELAAEELRLLKGRATQMGLTFHPSIGIEKLKLKVANRLEGAEAQAEESKVSTPITTSVVAEKRAETQNEMHARLRKEAGRLVRIRVSCMNPNKKEYEGDIFTVSNSIVGTYKKYVPYNNEDGWHVPNIIFEHLKERQCQIFYTAKGPRGNKIRKGKLIKEFAIEVLPPLTRTEMEELATKQAMSNNLD